jgi:hypothetical protein
VLAAALLLMLTRDFVRSRASVEELILNPQGCHPD